MNDTPVRVFLIKHLLPISRIHISNYIIFFASKTILWFNLPFFAFLFFITFLMSTWTGRGSRVWRICFLFFTIPFFHHKSLIYFFFPFLFNFFPSPHPTSTNPTTSPVFSSKHYLLWYYSTQEQHIHPFSLLNHRFH